MAVGFYEPDTVRLGRILITRNFLLIEAPVWQFDFVTEEIASSEDMSKLELCSQGSDSLLRVAISIGLFRNDLHLEIVICITVEIWESVG